MFHSLVIKLGMNGWLGKSAVVWDRWERGQGWRDITLLHLVGLRFGWGGVVMFEKVSAGNALVGLMRWGAV